MKSSRCWICLTCSGITITSTPSWPLTSASSCWTALTSTGARMLCMQAVGFRNMDMCTGPVKTPADIAGHQIRVTDSPIYRAQYEAWGANPQIIAGPEVLTALQQGTIDGCDNVHNVQYADRYYEFAKYISITEHAVHFNGLTINNALFEGLSARPAGRHPRRRP